MGSRKELAIMGDKPGPYPRPGGPGTGTGK